MSSHEKVVTITGGAGRIAYSLIPLILHGHAFGADCGIHLRLLDIPSSESKLHGVLMEIEDSYYPLLRSVVATCDPQTAFAGCEVAVLVGGFPRLPGMERRDLLVKNAQSIKAQAEALNEFGAAHAKVLVVANPANTNCLVAIRSAPRIAPQNFTCLTRLDQERLRGMCAKRMSVPAHCVRNVFILGNHSTTQVAHTHAGEVVEGGEVVARLRDHVTAVEYDAMLQRVQQRGAEILKVLQASSALSAAEAIVRHLCDWLGPARDGEREAFSMGVLSDGAHYGVPADIVFSLPCERCADSPAGYRVLPGLDIDEKTAALLLASADELLLEKSHVEEFLR